MFVFDWLLYRSDCDRATSEMTQFTTRLLIIIIDDRQVPKSNPPLFWAQVCSAIDISSLQSVV